MSREEDFRKKVISYATFKWCNYDKDAGGYVPVVFMIIKSIPLVAKFLMVFL